MVVPALVLCDFACTNVCMYFCVFVCEKDMSSLFCRTTAHMGSVSGVEKCSKGVENMSIVKIFPNIPPLNIQVYFLCFLLCLFALLLLLCWIETMYFSAYRVPPHFVVIITLWRD